MHESRQSPVPEVSAVPAVPRGPAGPGAGFRRTVALPPALCGFVLLLALIFTASYAAGVSAGPVAPGMHGPGTGGTGGAGTDEMGDMGGMDDAGEGGR